MKRIATPEEIDTIADQCFTPKFDPAQDKKSVRIHIWYPHPKLTEMLDDIGYTNHQELELTIPETLDLAGYFLCHGASVMLHNLCEGVGDPQDIALFLDYKKPFGQR